MAAPSITIDVAGSSGTGTQPHDTDLAALMIAWAAVEPERVGEVALLAPEGGARILGRGDGGSERLVFHRQRPGVLEATAPLTSPGISREQLRVRPFEGGLLVERLGKCAMEVRGERVDRATLEPGDTLLLRGQLLLACTTRPPRLAPLHSASPADAPAFGQPDAHGIVGESPAAWRLRDQLAWLGKADEHTLVLGGSGAGKELCARAIHALSSRARGPFVARNAATIPASLVDAELFGNVKGYPNPGMPERPGLIGAADGGTLFLDEIGELPHSQQASLLRVLDEGEYHRLGGSAALRSRFRLLGATNRDPSALKHDLGARLVLRLEVPGVDDRRDDIPLLVRHLLRRASAKSPEATARFREASGPDLRVKASLVNHLVHTRYTTNLREMDALLWRAMLASTGEAIGWRSDASAPGSVAPSVDEAVDEGAPSKAPEPSEAEVRSSLAEQGGNVVRTAQALGLSSRYVLYRLMRKYGIED